MSVRVKTTQSRVERVREKLARKKSQLRLWELALDEILTGGDQSYSIGGRQISRRTYSAQLCRDEIRQLEEEIEALEDALAGYSPRISKRLIPRDW